MTSPETWEKIKRIFHEAREMEPGNRLDFAKAECGDDSEVWAEVERLLLSLDDSEGFIEESILASSASYSGKKIGNYRIVREIGRGGMGVVLLANREGGEFEQQVAIKILKRGIDSDEIVKCFSQERQILASLNHPNIAGLLDGGTTDDGLPYFVMEYVDGMPLIRYCAEIALTEDEKIRLFRDVCSAVSFSHGRLIVHRDLKPSNILVTNDGVPKLLDFGIAKILGADAEATRLTQTSNRLLTPEYASPEQIRGEEITTASDVYSLGVILYELLTGKLPYNFTTRSSEEVFRLVCDVEPVSPETTAGIRIDSDLKNIVLMALRKEWDRRYESVEKLSEDLRRYEAHLPVTARADTWKYRSSKFARRNRVAVAAGILIFLSLVAGIAATAWQATIARRERDKALIEAKRSEGLNAFLQSILVAPDPETDGKDVKFIEVLAAAGERIEGEFSDQPELKADALNIIGYTYNQLGLYDLAEPKLREARELNLANRGISDVHTFKSNALLGECLGEQNKTNEARGLLEDAVSRGREIYPSGSSDLAFALMTLGEDYNRGGDPEEAKPILAESAAMYRSTEGGDSPNVVTAMLALARVREFTNDYAGAEADEREVLRISRKLPKKFDIRTAQVLSNLGNVLRINGKLDEGEILLREAVERSVIIQGEAYSSAQARYYYSRLLLEKGDLKMAEAEARKSVEILTAIKLQNYTLRLSMSVLGLALTKMGRSGEGEILIRKALTDEMNVQPKDERHVAVFQMALGECLLHQNKFTEAETQLLAAHEVLQRAFTDRNAYTRQASLDLVTLYEKWPKDRAGKFRESKL